MDLKVEVHQEGTGYWAHVVELPGCFASGRSLDELHEAVGDAIGLYVWDRPVQLNAAAPLGAGSVYVTVEAPEGP